jgi:acyl phosphate:glycerol-3-phosphate acyltransferase
MSPWMWALLGFVAGSLPFSVLIGRLALGTDIRRFGDGNPGGSNVMKAGSRAWGLVAILLDAAKGAVPVGAAYWLSHLGLAPQIGDWSLVVVALAPVMGHAWSPFLHFRGGKAVAVTFGIWAGLTLWEGPTVLGLLLAFWYALLAADSWVVMAMMGSFLAFLIAAGVEPAFLGIWAGNTLILGWTHRRGLGMAPGVRPWLVKAIHR